MTRYITHISLAPAASMGQLTLAPDGHTAALSTKGAQWHTVPTTGLAAMEVSDDVADGRHTVTAKLTATLCGRYTPMAGPVAVLLTCADGTRLLLGTGERPMPAVTLPDTLPDKAAERSAQTLTITYSSRPLALMNR
nr:MAG TPA: hypothetical protein [Caudoviricetes sp.]